MQRLCCKWEKETTNKINKRTALDFASREWIFRLTEDCNIECLIIETSAKQEFGPQL